MFFVEYTEHNERKALNLATCQTLETKVTHTSSKSSYNIIVKHKEFSQLTIECETEAELSTTFESLMNALKEYQAHWMSPKTLCASSED